MHNVVFVAVVALFWAGCGATTRQEGSAGNGGAVGSAGSAGDGSTAAAGANGAGAPAGETELELLNACEAEEPCPPSSAQLIEGFTRTFDAERAACLLRALRDRTPGRYQHEVGDTNTATSRGTAHTVVLTGGDEAMYASVSHSSSYDGRSDNSAYGAPCRLKPRSYFDACLAALQADVVPPGSQSPAWDCVFSAAGMPWFSSCDEAGELSCEEPACGTADTQCCEGEPLPCQGLGVSDCEARDECRPIFGLPFEGSTDVEPPWNHYVGCRAACREPGGDAVSCTFDPAAPKQCFVIPSSAGPDGWVEDFECEGCSAP